MKIKPEQNRSSMALQAADLMLQGDVSHRTGKMGSVVVKGKVIDLDQFFSTTNVGAESLDESFDKTAHDFQSEADEYLQVQTGQHRSRYPFDE